MNKKEHASHNEQACKFLHENGNYCDWVVTTAFYSALHFLQHEIFPKEIKGKQYDTFDKYYNLHYAGGVNKPNKHVSTLNLIKSEMGDTVYANYKWLYDLCMTARYRDYKVHDFIANESIKRLAQIKSFLKK